MNELIEKLGIDWKLLLAQAANFLIILVVLRFTLYKPLIRILSERRMKIDQGLRDAEAAGKRLGEVEIVGKERLATVEREAVKIVQDAEGRAKVKESEILTAAKAKEIEVVKGAERLIEARRAESEEIILAEAKTLVREAVLKTGSLVPNAVDEALLKEALGAVKKFRS